MEMSKSNEHGNRCNIFTLKSNESSTIDAIRTATVNYATIYKSHHQTRKGKELLFDGTYFPSIPIENVRTIDKYRAIIK